MGTIVTKDATGSLDRVVSRILRSPRAAAAKAAVQFTRESFVSLAGVDYAGEIRKQLDVQQLREIFGGLHGMLPGLNETMFAITDLRQLKKIAADHGAVMRARSFAGKESRFLRGFYVPAARHQEPLICINTANHEVTVAAAFWHELAHHLTTSILGRHRHGITLNLNSVYLDHLAQVDEIVADMVMALGCYPGPVARKLFRNLKGEPGRDADQIVHRVLPHVRTAAGLDFEDRFSAVDNLHYLAGLIHLAKLRAALLAEYGI